MAVKFTVQDIIDAAQKALAGTPKGGHPQLLQQLKARRTGQPNQPPQPIERK